VLPILCAEWASAPRRSRAALGVSGYGGGMQTSKEEKRMQDSVENLVTLFEKGTLNRQQLIQGLLAAMAPISMVADAQADTSTLSTFRGRSLNHVTLSVTDVERSQEFYSRLLGGTMSCRSIQTDKGTKVESATLALPEGFIALFKLGEPKVHHFCVGVENFSIDAALEKLKSEFPESKPITYRGQELYFRDPDGILGQISGMDYRGQLTTP
jgi:catechol 2,3-dioxygenase-like lactoylglutathione lyase family enzyme